jgi:hypothetical protein
MTLYLVLLTSLGVKILVGSKRFEMSMIGDLTFFLGFQIKQFKDGTFISQTKYIKDIIKKFACWGLDMIEPLTTMPGGFTHVLVAIDKFTKWIEYKPIAMISADRVVTSICNILHHFGFPNTIITNLGSNFHSQQFCDFCECSSIEVKYVSVVWQNQPEVHRLKYASPLLRAPTYFKLCNPLAYQVTS